MMHVDSTNAGQPMVTARSPRLGHSARAYPASIAGVSRSHGRNVEPLSYPLAVPGVRRAGCVIAAAGAALMFASSAGAAVHLVRLTSPVEAGSEATLTARVLPRAVRCSITVTYKSGPSHASGLSPKRPSRTGRVSWTWEVGPSTTSGRWPIVVSCGRAGTLHVAIKVGGKGSGSPPPEGARSGPDGPARASHEDERVQAWRASRPALLARCLLLEADQGRDLLATLPYRCDPRRAAVGEVRGRARIRKAASYYGRSVEIDHIVPLELGGSNSIANLYFEPGSGAANYHAKDRLENKLHDMVCSGSITLRRAQRQIATNWKTLYRNVFGRAP